MIALIIILVFFLITRINMLLSGPQFTDVIYSYYDYARLWNEGYTPYLKHLFEYPPANIILFYIPKIFDLARIYTYSEVYRFIIFIFDLIIFFTAILVLRKLKLKKSIFYLSLIYYITATFKARDFVYDSMDLVFIACLFFSLILPVILKNGVKARFAAWLFFWLSTAFKYITFPLAIPFLILRLRSNFWEEIKLCILSFTVVWGIPLVLFRSSLSVSFIYHLKRGFQVESVPANIIRLINSWTKSERYIEVFKNYDIVGPLTTKLTPILSAIFILTVAIFFVYSVKKSLMLSNNRNVNEYVEKLKLSIIFLCLFLLTSKVFSTPFHLWLPPLLMIYPFKSIKKQLIVLITSFIMIAISMTPIPNIKFFIFDVHTAIGIARPFCLLVILYQINKT